MGLNYADYVCKSLYVFDEHSTTASSQRYKLFSNIIFSFALMQLLRTQEGSSCVDLIGELEPVGVCTALYPNWMKTLKNQLRFHLQFLLADCRGRIILYYLNGNWGTWINVVCETQHHNTVHYCIWDGISHPAASSTRAILKAQGQACLGQQTPINMAGSLLHSFLFYACFMPRILLHLCLYSVLGAPNMSPIVFLSNKM